MTLSPKKIALNKNNTLSNWNSRPNINTCATHLYGIMDENDILLCINNNYLYTKRQDARDARKLVTKKARIVKCLFTNYDGWVTAK